MLNLIIGWQPIPSNWLIRRGYMAVFLTETHNLLLFSIKKKSDMSDMNFFCHFCSRKRCNHIIDDLRQERENQLLSNYPFEFDNDLEDYPDEDFEDLVSKKPYPCNIYIYYINDLNLS
jgi:hypothetical protein